MKGTDADLIERLGGAKAVADALPADGKTADQMHWMVKKWCTKGRAIPWSWRSKVLKLARDMGKRVPADFLAERRAA
jgi:hypothetical protein